MPGKPTSGNRSGARGKPTRVRRRITREAARVLDKELAWLTEDVQDEVLSALIERAPRDWWEEAIDMAREMGLDMQGSIPDETGDPITL